MRIPESPPDYRVLLQQLSKDAEGLQATFGVSSAVDSKGRYLHWDEMRRRKPPGELTLEQWWTGTAIARRATAKPLPLLDTSKNEFTYSNIDEIQNLVHQIDQHASGQILADDVVTNLRSSDRYLVSSLVEEAITSSQLEGASTTRKVAKDLLQTGRKPRDRSEQMIVNNYSAMLCAETLAGDRPINVDDILELHRVVTTDALDNPLDAGRIQTPEEERIAIHWTDNTLLHQPPPAIELNERLENLCSFANGELDTGFIHPVVRAIVIHFWLAYDHPFVDGNGRTSRALFYWSMLRSNYWLTQYISISSILRKAPAQYAKSYLYVETDNNDMTYFIVAQLRVILKAIESLKEYLSRKVAETRSLEAELRGTSFLNHRQVAIVSRALRDGSELFTINAHSTMHGVTYQSARTDLLGLEALGLFSKSKQGKKYVFRPVGDLSGALRELDLES